MAVDNTYYNNYKKNVLANRNLTEYVAQLRAESTKPKEIKPYVIDGSTRQYNYMLYDESLRSPVASGRCVITKNTYDIATNHNYITIVDVRRQQTVTVEDTYLRLLED